MLAIVIPYYKLTFFDKTLQSINNQTDQRFKVYIGNDASKANPEELLRKYDNSFEIVYKKFNDNLGSSSLVNQWHRCLDMINDEEWIMILGDDDVLGENVVEEFYKNLETVNDCQINVIRFSSVLINSITLKKSSVYLQEKKEQMIDFFAKKLFDKTRSSLSEYIFRKASYEKYRFKKYPLAWHSDDMAWFEFSENKPIFSINDATVYVRISYDSITGDTTNSFSKDGATIQFYTDLLNRNDVIKYQEVREKLLQTLEILQKKREAINLKVLLYFFTKRFEVFDFINLAKFIRRLIMFYLRK